MGLRLFWVGDSPTVPTGFGIVSKNLLKRFNESGYEIGVLGVNHYGDPYNPKEFPYPIWGGDHGTMEQVYGMHKIWPIVNQYQPDVIFFLNDPWIINDYLRNKPPSIESKIIAYYPTDAGPIKSEWVEMLKNLDAQICYSNFAERVMIESNENKRPDNLYQIYHGVDTKTFFPVSQAEARSKLNISLNSFIVGMIARNQYRKRFDILMKAFQIFAKDKPTAKIYLHTSMKDIGYDLIGLARSLDIEDKLIITEDVTSPVNGVDAKYLNLIYNTFDVNALISLGDGFGLPVAESMATGCPQLVSDHSCLKELVEGHGGLTVKTASWILNTAGINTWGGVTDINDLVDKLEQLYQNKDLRISLAQEGYDFIRQEKFTWDFAFSRFDRIIKDLFHII